MSNIFKASTIILLSPDKKVLLTRRKESLKFLGGFHVYPGGRVEEEDYEQDLIARIPERLLNNLSKEAFMKRREMAAHIVAGIREVFEETGIILSKNGVIVVEDPNRLEPVSFKKIVFNYDIYFPEKMTYVDHWITPPVFPVRFDTRFFLIQLDNTPKILPNKEEIEDYMWVSPYDALSLADKNRIKLMPPTYVTLKKIIKILAENHQNRIT